jgi:hypothetical protein
MMMLFGSSKPEPTLISLQLPDQLVVVRSRTKRRRSPSESSSRAAYNFDTDAEENARDAALTAIASRGAWTRRSGASRPTITCSPCPCCSRRSRPRPYLENGAADAHDAALRAFFAPAAEAKGEDHVPTMALWALASIGRAYPERMLHICQRTDEEECALFAAQAHGYYTALHVALYTRRVFYLCVDLLLLIDHFH